MFVWFNNYWCLEKPMAMDVHADLLAKSTGVHIFLFFMSSYFTFQFHEDLVGVLHGYTLDLLFSIFNATLFTLKKGVIDTSISYGSLILVGLEIIQVKKNYYLLM